MYGTQSWHWISGGGYDPVVLDTIGHPSLAIYCIEHGFPYRSIASKIDTNNAAKSYIKSLHPFDVERILTAGEYVILILSKYKYFIS